MATITLRGNPIPTAGDLPKVGDAAPDFSLVRSDLSRASLASFSGKKILNIFPSIDTPVCATSVRKFNKLASEKGLTVLNISEDLPFAQKRFCGAEGIDKCESLSAFRSSFGKDYGVEITAGPFSGLTARAVVVLDGDNKVIHSELVPEIAQEPNYDAALAVVG
jgi:thiol peroxidase